MKISIIVPTCSWPDPKDPNGGAHFFLWRMLDSILEARKDNIPDVEIMVGVDGKRPRVEQLIQYWCKLRNIPVNGDSFVNGLRFRLFRNDFTGTWGNHQRNVLIPFASGDIIHFIDHDDAYAKESLFKIAKHVERNPGKPIVAKMCIYAYKEFLHLANPHVLWQEVGVVEKTKVGGHVLFAPNVPKLLGTWTPEDYYEADFNFVSSTLQNFKNAGVGAIWVDDIVSEIRPYGSSII